jgi:hypothetical protein
MFRNGSLEAFFVTVLGSSWDPPSQALKMAQNVSLRASAALDERMNAYMSSQLSVVFAAVKACPYVCKAFFLFRVRGSIMFKKLTSKAWARWLWSCSCSTKGPKGKPAAPNSLWLIATPNGHSQLALRGKACQSGFSSKRPKVISACFLSQLARTCNSLTAEILPPRGRVVTKDRNSSKELKFLPAWSWSPEGKGPEGTCKVLGRPV